MKVRALALLLITMALSHGEVRFVNPPFSVIYYVTLPDSNGDQLVVGKLRDVHVLAPIPLPTALNEMFADKSVELAPGVYFSSVYVPSAAERSGVYTYFGVPLPDPHSPGINFPMNIIPPARFGDPWAFRVKRADLASASYALPQLAFGGGWYTALYFSNTTNAATTAVVKFYGPNGTPLSVPLSGAGPVSEHTLNINPNATAFLEALDVGDLQQGWAKGTLPAGVIGYGVFRQTVEGLWWRATYSCGEQRLQRLGDILTALDHVRQHLKGYRLRPPHGLFLACRIGHHPRKVRYGCQEAAILFPFHFDADWLNLNHG